MEKGWVVIEGISDGADGVKNRYFWNGNPAIRHTLSSYTARHLAGYFLLERDIRNIRTWISEILEILEELGPISDDFTKSHKREGDPKKNNLIKGLLVAVLAIYGKLFTTAKGRRVSLNARIITDPKHFEHHETLMQLRHSFAAHSGEELHERCVIVAALAPDNDKVVCKLCSELSQPNHFSRKVYREFDSLMEFLNSHVMKKRIDLWQRVQQRDLSESELHSILELYGKSGVLASYFPKI